MATLSSIAAGPCPLCSTDGGEVLARAPDWRIVLPHEPDLPGFVRVIRNAHAAEMTDLPAADRHALMEVVWAVEAIVRATLQPDKINLASLGNVVPHLHWHVIPRWADDRWFPQPVWAAPLRPAEAALLDARTARVAALRTALRELGTWPLPRDARMPTRRP